ncbi:MAG: peptidylprolyl isomerase [Chloroflexi bacterium]|nr:peptidylprolyl isomerase [Chloroflexota bacterium]MBU1748649.1 peptidylprolyl isomerase [Chloroflexota bacterium]
MSSKKTKQDRRDARRRPSQETEPRSRKQRARSRKDQRRQIIVFAFIGIVVALLVGTLGWGWYQANVAEPNQPIVVVNGQGVSTSLYKANVLYQRFVLQQQYLALQQRIDELQSDPNAGFIIQIYQQQMSNLEGSFAELPWQVLEQLVNSELVRQNVTALEIQVPTDAEVDQEIQSRFGYYTTPPTPVPPEPTHPPYPTAPPAPTATLAPTATVTATATPAPTATPVSGTPTATPEAPTPEPTAASVSREDWEKNITAWLNAAGINMDELREIVRRDLLMLRAQESLQSRIPASIDQVHIRHIQMTDETQARAVLTQAQGINYATDPEGFANLARELSEDALTKDEGGDLGWQIHELLAYDSGVALADAAFALTTPGELSPLVQDKDGNWHIIQLIERDTNRLIDGDQWDIIWGRALNRWLAIQKESAQIERYWSSDKVPPATGFLGE